MKTLMLVLALCVIDAGASDCAAQNVPDEVYVSILPWVQQVRPGKEVKITRRLEGPDGGVIGGELAATLTRRGFAVVDEADTLDCPEGAPRPRCALRDSDATVISFGAAEAGANSATVPVVVQTASGSTRQPIHHEWYEVTLTRDDSGMWSISGWRVLGET